MTATIISGISLDWEVCWDLVEKSQTFITLAAESVSAVLWFAFCD